MTFSVGGNIAVLSVVVLNVLQSRQDFPSLSLFSVFISLLSWQMSWESMAIVF